MTTDKTFVIVGAGHAGGRAAQAMRMAGFDGRIILIGEERYLPYERPPLSKALLATDEGIERATLNPAEWYEEHRIEMWLETPAEALDRAAKEVRCAGGKAAAYDRLLLTTGARVRRIDVPGVDLPGVHYLRNFDDTEAIRVGLRPGTKVVVIGGGFIGLEAAASARARSCSVAVVEMTSGLMGRAVALEIGEYFAALHQAKNVDLRLETAVAAIEGPDRVSAVRLTNGETIPANVVIIGIGIAPNVELAADAGLDVENGIAVDEYGATSDPDIFAAGDVANQPNEFLGRRVRLESYQNAQDQATAVARNMCAHPGAEKPYNDRLWVWTDQYDVNLQMLGAPLDYDRLVWRGEKESGSFTAFYMQGQRIVAVNTINNGKEMRLCERLMYAGRAVDDELLADPSAKLRDLLK